MISLDVTTARPRYGVMSIGLSHDPKTHTQFSGLYKAIGQNTGNLLFSNAVWEQLDGEKERIPFVFNPDEINEKFDAVVIPAANWVNETVDFTHVAAPIEQLKIPVAVIGLGAQSENYRSNLSGLPDGTHRFLKAVFDRSESVSVRGEYTKKLLKKLGFSNTDITGCPSLYYNFISKEHWRTPKDEFNIKKCLIHSTRYTARHLPFAEKRSANRALFRFAYKHQLDYMYQSEPEEIAILSQLEDADNLEEILRSGLKKVYGAGRWHDLKQYIDSYGKVFFNTKDWATTVSSYQFVYGSRLHGTIMALNSGVSATLLFHDSRTREIAEFAALPSLNAQKADISVKGVMRAYEKADLRAYQKQQAVNYRHYKSFFKKNRLRLNENTNIYGG